MLQRKMGIQNSSPMNSHVLRLNLTLDFVLTREKQSGYKRLPAQQISVAGMGQVPRCFLRTGMDKSVPDLNFLMSGFPTSNKAVRNLQLHALHLAHSPNKQVSRHHIPSRCCLVSHEVTPWAAEQHTACGVGNSAGLLIGTGAQCDDNRPPTEW